MGKPKLPNFRNNNLQLRKRIEGYIAAINNVYDTVAKQVSQMAFALNPEADKPFSFSDYPSVKKQILDIQSWLASQVEAIIQSSTSEEWNNCNVIQNLVADKVLKQFTGTTKHGEEYSRYYLENTDALKAFQERRENGINLSDNVWKITEPFKTELEESITAALGDGTSAMELAAQVKQYLKDPDKRFRRIRDKVDENKLHLSNPAKAYHPGAGRYRSSARNAQRLARTEINMAYRTAEQTRWRQFDFVVGYEVKTTQNGHHVEDICDDLAGKYPKDFIFKGWHPNCYSDDSEVLTDQGWKLFKDVTDDDLILSLDPDTRKMEWAGIVDRQCYERYGEMVRFFNKSLDCLVTPEHRMVYLKKSDGSIKYCRAEEYTKGKGAFYRGARYFAWDRISLALEDREVTFDDFCEFMAYYLSDGSLQHGTGVIISQRCDQPAFDSIIAVAERMGYSPKVCKDTIAIYNSALNRYLSQFGKCADKFIPEEIKTASKRQIRIFLNAFIKCDGNCRKPKSFIGNHGNEFRSEKDERVYFTTSERLAGDLSEMILKIGHRPSFYTSEPGIACKKDGSTIKGNYRCCRISECYSTTATVFRKEIIPYSGNVYDLTLERNHIMYIRRKGKCFWGSNCMCYTIPILKTEEEFWAYDEENPQPSVNEVTDVPDGFKEWIRDNSERIETAKKRGTLSYFIKDNQERVTEILENPVTLGGNAKSAEEKARIETNRREYERLLADPNYKDVEFNPENGGLKATHDKHNFNGRTGWYEKSVQEVGFNYGNSVILEEEIHSIHNKKNVEGTFNSLPFEIAGAETGIPNNIRNALKHCASKPNCKVAVIFYPDETKVDMKSIREGMKKYYGLRKDPKQFTDFQTIYVMTPTRIIYVQKKQGD